MGVMVIAAYRPKPGKDAQLLDILRDHMSILREQDLITDRPATFMRTKDGSIVEIFEWKSEEAIEAAHTNARVREAPRSVRRSICSTAAARSRFLITSLIQRE